MKTALWCLGTAFFLGLTSIAVAGSCFLPSDVDTDGDGLIDFQELHKYRTDPMKADSDGDGVADGDWNERREFNYSICMRVQVMKPCTPEWLSDDFQDVKVIEERADSFELEVVLYPLNSVNQSIKGDADWRKKTGANSQWLESGLTSNWDEPFRNELIKSLRQAGIDAAALDDKSLVEQASEWLCKHARYQDGFTTFFTDFSNRKPNIPGPLQDRAEMELKKSGYQSFEEQWEREISSQGMFKHAIRGSCTSSAIYLNGCLRAIGMPTRIILCIPIIDTSDSSELRLLEKGISNHKVRRIINEGIGGLGDSWSSHTFNEVFVGGRWRRLNYQKLGQDILDPNCFGLLIHVATVSDWSDANAAATIGMRQGLENHDDRFGGSNPYSTIAISDQFGEHAQLQNPESTSFASMTIDQVIWSDSDDLDEQLRSQLATGFKQPVLLAHVSEWDGFDPLKEFTQHADSRFYLEAEGESPIEIDCHQGGITNQSGSIRFVIIDVGAADHQQIRPDITYRLRARNEGSDRSWVVAKDVTVSRKTK